VRVSPGAAVCSGLKPTSTPEDSVVRVSSPTWNEARADARSFFSVTSRHSPAAAWTTSGSGSLAPLFTAAASYHGTKAASRPATLPGTSTALTRIWRRGASAGHGWPGPRGAGGAPPVTPGTGFEPSPAGTDVPGSCSRSPTFCGRTRMIPHAPWRRRRPRPLK
jgi:hypothetical protein